MGRRREQIKRGLMDQMQDLGRYPRRTGTSLDDFKQN